MGRQWACIELNEEYCKGAIGRFGEKEEKRTEPVLYKLPKPIWNGDEEAPLDPSGGRARTKPV